jgi:hypothetical protein
MAHTEGVTWGAGHASLSEPPPFHAPEIPPMLNRFKRQAKAKAINMNPPSLAQGGLAFILAYTIAYAFFSR